MIVDRKDLTGSINVVETVDGAAFEDRPVHPEIRRHPKLPDDTRLWAALQQASGGTWRGAIYDVDRIVEIIAKGLSAE